MRDGEEKSATFASIMHEEQTIPLCSFSSIRTGYTFKGPLQTVSSSAEIAVLQPRDIENRALQSSFIWVDRQKIKTFETHCLKAGDILVANKGTKFGTFLYKGAPEVAIASSSFFIIRPHSDKLMSLFLEWYLNRPSVKNHFILNSSGSTVKSISKKVLESLEIPAISIEQQKKVVDFLILAEKERNLMLDAIRKKEQLNNSYVWDIINATEA